MSITASNPIVVVLVGRDDIGVQDAIDFVEEVKEMVQEAIDSGDVMEAEEIFQSELGLEPDYLFDLF